MINFHHWIRDYFYAAKGHARALVYKKPPKHYLGLVKENLAPIILIPGVLEKWHFLKDIADPLSLKGHPVYVLERLGYNIGNIPKSAEIIHKFIVEKQLKNIIIIAHSKGGLIGKYLLLFFNQDQRVTKLIAIAAPFGGSKIAELIPLRFIRKLSPLNQIIKSLQKEKRVNHQIISIYALFDNHVWPHTSPILECAENIQVKVHGHHTMVFDKKVVQIALSKI